MLILIKQALKFFGISGVGWIIDFLIFTVFTTVFKIDTAVSNICSSMVAITFVFFISTKKTFINKNKSFNLKLKYIVYITYQIIVIAIVSILIKATSEYISENFALLVIEPQIFAKIIVTPFTMILNFIFMKFLIEKL